MRRLGILFLVALLAGCGGSRPPATPQTTASPPATPEPYIALAGKIEFGADFDPDSLEIIRPASRFHATSRHIAYVAHLLDSAGATELTLTLTRRASGGAETTIYSWVIEVANPDFDTFANWYDFAAFADRELGTYVLRIVREGRLLAEGSFQLVK